MSRKQKRETLPYAGSKLTPMQSRDSIEKMLKKAGCKKYQWTMIDNQFMLQFALPVRVAGVEKFIAFRFLPPQIPKTIRQWNPKTYKYEKIVINDDVAAFRVLYWYLKNKLIAIDVGLVSAEKELMANILCTLPNGRNTTLGERLEQEMLPQITEQQDSTLLPQPEQTKENKPDESKIIDQ